MFQKISSNNRFRRKYSQNFFKKWSKSIERFCSIHKKCFQANVIKIYQKFIFLQYFSEVSKNSRYLKFFKIFSMFHCRRLFQNSSEISLKVLLSFHFKKLKKNCLKYFSKISITFLHNFFKIFPKAF